MYWYQFFTCCEVLVTILHIVKFTRYEICGSTVVSDRCTAADLKRSFAINSLNVSSRLIKSDEMGFFLQIHFREY